MILILRLFYCQYIKTEAILYLLNHWIFDNEIIGNKFISNVQISIFTAELRKKYFLIDGLVV